MASEVDLVIGVEHGPGCTCRRLAPITITIQPVIVGTDCPERDGRAVGGPMPDVSTLTVGEDGCTLTAPLLTTCTCGTTTAGPHFVRPDCPVHHPVTPAQHITINMSGTIADPADLARQIRESVRRYGGPGGGLVT